MKQGGGRTVAPEVRSPWDPPKRIARPVMLHRWSDLSFLHWAYPPTTVQALLPEGLQVDTFDGAAWVGLIPFRLTVTLPGIPAVPWIGSCPEVNVRTYVRGPDGGQGIWFLSLEASRLAAVLTARRAYGLPYRWAAMRLDRRDRTIWYETSRRWRGRRPREVIALALGEPVAPEQLAPLETFLTARWRLYSPRRDSLAVTEVEHVAWPTQRAEPLCVRDELIAAAGLPEPIGPPMTLFSPGVSVRFGRRRQLGAASDALAA
jgi:uncharacterized protein YqjF (DUF2071 family)